MPNFSPELKRYVVLQILDFVNEQARDMFVSKSKMNQLKQGVENICFKAFGAENMRYIKSEAPRVVRASLEARQLGVGGKIMRFLDSKRKKQASELFSIFADIKHKDKFSSNAQNEVINNTWLERMRSQKAESREKQKVLIH